MAVTYFVGNASLAAQRERTGAEGCRGRQTDEAAGALRGLGAWAAGLRGDPRNVKWRMGADYKASGLKENSRTTVSAAHVGGCPVVAPVAWAGGDPAGWLVGSPTELAVMAAADIASKPHPV